MDKPIEKVKIKVEKKNLDANFASDTLNAQSKQPQRFVRTKGQNRHNSKQPKIEEQEFQ